MPEYFIRSSLVEPVLFTYSVIAFSNGLHKQKIAIFSPSSTTIASCGRHLSPCTCSNSLPGCGCIDNLEDLDDDDDSILDENDSCPLGETGWSSWVYTDFDGDGCLDNIEDLDDDGDGICDENNNDENCNISSISYDLCPASSLEFMSNTQTDNDGDGCLDFIEDLDSDNDGYFDLIDDYPLDSSRYLNLVPDQLS